IDDLEIVATAPAIDGPGQVLGQAGPDQLRQGGGNLPFLGVMEFDSADVSIMELDGTLFDVILHEMGHVLGIGTLWSSNGLVVGEGSADPRYIGPNAVREFRTLSGNATAVDIPVENTGGPGTADGHWRESVFGSELMTGRAEPPGVASPISRMTTGALEDLGYLVNYASSDSYTIPAAVRNRAVFGLAVGNLPLMASMTSRLPSGLFASLVHGGAPESAGPPARQRAFARLLPS
ncbi:MAG: leishmanolysin-related zinc metalloendopeptidase, partial [Planctomycetota bacterium]